VLLNRPFASPECSLQGDAAAENKALVLRDVNERVVCSQTDRGATLVKLQRFCKRRWVRLDLSNSVSR
jgi:hypothetical protein